MTVWASSPIPMRIRTPACHLDGKVDARTIYNRKRSLMALQRKISRKRNRALIGREFPVLVEGPSADSDLVWQARLSTQAPDIDGVCYISDPGEQVLEAGQIRRMRITEAHDYDLTGELVDQPQFLPTSVVQSSRCSTSRCACRSLVQTSLLRRLPAAIVMTS